MPQGEPMSFNPNGNAPTVIDRKSDDHSRMKVAMRAAMLRSRGLGPRTVRAVTHLDVSRDEVVRAAGVLRDLFSSTRS